MALSCIISEIKQDRPTGRKLQFFHAPPAYAAPVKMDPWEFRHMSCGKTRMVGLPESEKV